MTDESYLEPTYTYGAKDETGTQLSLRHDLDVLFSRVNALLSIVNYDSTRQFITITGRKEQVSTAVDTVVLFHIPTQATTIKKISLTCYGERYTVPTATATATEVVDFPHFHSTTITASTAGTTVKYSASSLKADLTANGTVNVNSAVNTAVHSHSLTLTLAESTTPLVVKAYYHNGSSYDAGETLGTASDATTPWTIKTEYDITGKYSGTGHKKLKFTSSRLGCISYQLMMELEMSPTA